MKSFSQKGFTKNFLHLMEKVGDKCCDNNPFNIFTEDSDTITLQGEGTQQSPLKALLFNIFTEDTDSIILQGEGTEANPLMAILSPLAAGNGLSVNSLTGQIVLGNDAGNTEATLISNREIPLAGKSITFTGAGSVSLASLANGNSTFFQAGFLYVGKTLDANQSIQMEVTNPALQIIGNSASVPARLEIVQNTPVGAVFGALYEFGVSHYTEVFANRAYPMTVARGNSRFALQAAPFSRQVIEWFPGATSTTCGYGAASTGTGTFAQISPTFGIDLVSGKLRASETSATIANSIASIGFTTANWSLGTGFFAVFNFNLTTYIANSSGFFGFTANATSPLLVEPSNAVNIIGFGYDAADTTMNFFINNASGIATKTVLPAATLASGSSYRAYLYKVNTSSNIYYKLFLNETLIVDTFISDSNVPTSNTALFFILGQCNLANAGSAVAVGASMIHIDRQI